MDVASWVVICSCLAQGAGDRYGGTYGTTPSYGTPPAGTSTPYSQPTAPAYPPATQDPQYTAATQKKTNPATNVTPPGARTAVPPNTTATPQSNVAKTQPPASATTEKTAAGELIREALVVPQSLSVAGRSTTLYEALSFGGEPRQQLDAVRAYWHAAAELAEYHYDWQQTQFLEHLQKVTASRGGDNGAAGAEIAARLASARAELREAELGLTDVQSRLTDLVPTLNSGGRPLPADLPHVGTYHARFEKVYGGRTPTPRAYALNRSLPLRKEVVDMRADGVWAAQDAYEAAFDAYQKNQLPIEEVLTALDDFRLRRTEFIGAVRRYNDEIAEYAVLSAPWGVGADALVRMLIKNPQRPASAGVGAVYDDADGVVPASFDEAPMLFEPVPDPVSASSTGSAAPNLYGGVMPAGGSTLVVPPTPPVPRNPPPPGMANGAVPEPFTPAGDAAPLMPFPPPTSAVPPSAGPPQFTMPGGASPTLAPPQSLEEPGSASTQRIKVNKIPLSPGDDASAAAPQRSGLLDVDVVPVAYFAQLAALPPAERAQDLVEALYATAATSDAQAPRLTLAQCLAKVDISEQPRVVSAYWNAAEQAARADLSAKSAGRLDALGNAVLRMNDSVAKSSAMLRVRSARLAAEADRAAARASLEAYRAELTAALNQPLSEPWPLPVTAPHGGGYDTKIEALSASASASAGVRRMAGRIDGLHDAIVLRAEAVVHGDAACDAMLQQFTSGRATAHMVVADIARQADDTAALLSATTRYNLTIAGYALAVLPGGGRETLVGSLVLDRTVVAGRP